MVRQRIGRWVAPSRGIMVSASSGAFGDAGPESRWQPITSVSPEPVGRSAEHADDRSIVAAVLDGDRDAFRRLVDREGPSVVRACHRILGDLAEAEDAAQEAFLIGYRSLGTWRADGPFGAWITRIAVRIALREAGRRRTVAWIEPVRDPGSGPVVGLAERAAERDAIAAAPANDPASLTLRAERAHEVRVAVTSLPEPYREVVVMRFFGDATLDEIARVTGRPLGTVKTHLHRGLARLRDRLAEGTSR